MRKIFTFSYILKIYCKYFKDSIGQKNVTSTLPMCFNLTEHYY